MIAAAAALMVLGLARAAAQDPGHPYDVILHHRGDRGGVLGPSGRRLFASELSPGLGLRGRFGYGSQAHGFTDPLRLAVRIGGAPVELVRERVDWYPSHLAVTWRAAGLVLLERKLVDDDDELHAELELANESNGPLDVELLLWGDATPERERFLSRQVPVDLTDAATLSPALEGELGLAVARAGAMSYDGVRFALATPASARPVCVALRGDGEGQGTRELPERAAVELPDVGPALATLHLLVAAPAPTGARGPDPPARFVLHLDDGSRESVLWPALDSPDVSPRSERREWHRLVLPGSGEPALRLSYDPPPGRFLRVVELAKLPGAAVPTLLAATFEIPPETGRLPVLLGTSELCGVPVHLALAGTDFAPARGPDGERALARRLQLEPGESTTLRAVLSTGPERPMTALRALDRVTDEEAFARHRQIHAHWFEKNVPAFTCSDERLVRAWHERWTLVRRSMLRLELPDFSLPVFYRGLRARGDDRIDLGDASAVLREVRWLRDPTFAQGHLRALQKLQGPDGLLRSVGPGVRGEREPHWLALAALGVFEVHGREQLLREVLPGLARDLEATLELRAAREGGEEPLEEAVFLHVSARALARGFEAIRNESEARRFEELATRLEAGTVVSEAHPVAFLDAREPLEPRRLAALGELVEDALRSLDSSGAQESDSTSLALLADSVGGAARHGMAAPFDTATFRKLLDALAARHNGRENAALDVLDSHFADLLIRHVAGVIPAAGHELELDPLDLGLAHFRFEGVPYQGHSLSVYWDRPDGVRAHADTQEGYTVLVDETQVWHAPGLASARVRLSSR